MRPPPGPCRPQDDSPPRLPPPLRFSRQQRPPRLHAEWTSATIARTQRGGRLPLAGAVVHPTVITTSRRQETAAPCMCGTHVIMPKYRHLPAAPAGGRCGALPGTRAPEGPPHPRFAPVIGRVACALLLALTLASSLAAWLPNAQAGEPVRLQLHWQPQAQFAGYYVALEKGFYEAHGLDVCILPGGNGHTPAGAARPGHGRRGHKPPFHGSPAA